MKTRIISGVVFAILGIIFLMINNPIVDTVVVTLLALIGMREYFNAFKSTKIKPIKWVGYIACLGILMYGNSLLDTATKVMVLKIMLPISVIGTFCYIVLTNLKRTIVDIAITFFGILYVPLLFIFLKLILTIPDYGRLYFIYVIIAAFVSDTAAYFIGCKFGKNKLCPDISPKKSVEGAVAGVVAVAVVFAIYTAILKIYANVDFSIILMVVAGIISAIAGQFGDLSASAVKRYCKIKDFGNIMPGHGGVLDRFDSILFVAPMIYAFINIYLLK